MSVDTAIGRTVPGTAEPASDRSPVDMARRVTIIALVLAVVPLAWHAWAALHGYFTQDDFVFTHQAAHTPLSLDYVFQSYGSGAHSGGPHIMPLQFVLIWLVTRVAPGNYGVAVLPLLVMQALATWVLWRLLARLFPGNPARLVPFGVFTLSPVIFITSMWWAFGLQIIPFVLALFGAVYGLVVYLQTGRWRHVWLAVFATVVGMLFWEKAALIVPVLFAVTALLSPATGVWGKARWAVREHFAVWATFGFAAVGYAALYLALASPAHGETLRRGDVGQLAQTMVTHAFLPRLFGGAWTRDFSASPAGLVVLIASLVAVFLVVAAWKRGGARATLAWLALAAYVVCDIVLLATARLGFVGPVIGGDPRYIADAIPVAVLLGSLAFMEPATTWPVWVRTASNDVRLPRSVTVGAVTLSLAAMVSIALAIPSAQNRESRRYASRLSRELEANRGMVLFDGGVPSAAMLPVFGDDWRLSRVVGVLQPAAKLDQTTDALFMADGRGRTRPFEFFFPTASVPGSVDQCGHLVQQQATDIALVRPVTLKHVVVRVDYFTGRSNDGTLQAGAARIAVPFKTGGVRSVYAVVDGPFESIRLSTGYPTCVAQVLVGGPAPLPN